MAPSLLMLSNVCTTGRGSPTAGLGRLQQGRDTAGISPAVHRPACRAERVLCGGAGGGDGFGCQRGGRSTCALFSVSVDEGNRHGKGKTGRESRVMGISLFVYGRW